MNHTTRTSKCNNHQNDEECKRITRRKNYGPEFHPRGGSISLCSYNKISKTRAHVFFRIFDYFLQQIPRFLNERQLRTYCW